VVGEERETGRGRRRLALELESRERTEAKWWVVGPGVANHHMSAHGVPGPPSARTPGPFGGWMDCPSSLPTRNAAPRLAVPVHFLAAARKRINTVMVHR